MKNKVPPPLLMIFTGTLMWLISRSPFSYRVSLPYFAETRTIVIGIGIIIAVIAMVQFARLKTTVNPLDLSKSTRLVTGGIFRISRNPMYLGLALMLVGWGIHLGSPVNILFIAAFMYYMTLFQIRPEEDALRGLFGEEYEDYCRKVRRWV
jgi:protein-S-isoprenylcysteine O-methyltransferase Ste14